MVVVELRFCNSRKKRLSKTSYHDPLVCERHFRKTARDGRRRVGSARAATYLRLDRRPAWPRDRLGPLAGELPTREGGGGRTEGDKAELQAERTLPYSR